MTQETEGKTPSDAVAKEPKRRTTTTRTAATPKEPPSFKPKVDLLTARAVRRVSTGQFEYLEIGIDLEALPDPNYSIKHNIAALEGLVVQEATKIAETVAREIQLNRGGS